MRKSRKDAPTGRKVVMITAIVLIAGISAAYADQADVHPAGTGQGWFWRSRPNVEAPNMSVPGAGVAVGGDVYTLPLPRGEGTLASKDWPPDHLYVGWDSLSKSAEMVSAVNFDLSEIPQGSKITRFVMTLIEHPNGQSPQAHKGANRAAALAQGIVACPWPEFFGGTTAAPMDQAPAAERKCDQGIAGAAATEPEGGEAVAINQLFKWTFDLTPMATNWASTENPSISLEPNMAAPSGSNWVTSFHSGVYKQDGQAAPGVFASVSFEPPPDDGSGGISFDEDVSDVGGFESFGGSGSLPSDDLAPGGPPAKAPRTIASGAFGEGRPADFWDIPVLMWVAAILLLLFVGGSGWALQFEALAGRPPGAASALMEGRNSRK
ncbi:MAG TPA: hypothetical protein VND22_03710 [Actinomycetota bacterium]|nr:hypothetical protein [Actinomycetota bacterium]